jgi:hypothetical protein
MAKLGFLDSDKKLMAYVDGDNGFFSPVAVRGGGQTMAFTMDDVIIARAEDVDGLRWVVERKLVTVVDRAAVERATLGDDGAPFAASFVQSLNEYN